jgi:hypothetical protein
MMLSLRFESRSQASGDLFRVVVKTQVGRCLLGQDTATLVALAMRKESRIRQPTYPSFPSRMMMPHSKSRPAIL